MASQLSHQHAPATPSIPDRLYFKIGDVARICSLETYVLRFWESQFPQLKPNKSGTGQRLYRRRDVELVLEIKRLVHGEGYTLAGARQALEPVRHRDAEPSQSLPSPIQTDQPSNVAAVIGRARAELREIAALLAGPEPQPARRRGKVTPMPSGTGSLFPA